MWSALHFVALILGVSVCKGSAGLRGRQHGLWPPANQIYSNPSSPPNWMKPSTIDPTLPLTAPPPVPASLPFPSAFSNLPLYYYSPVPAVSQGDSDASVWPPSPPRGNPDFFPGTAAMRPLSLLDAHGVEYMKDAKKKAK